MKTEISNGIITLKKYELDFIPLLFEAASESRGGDFTRWMPWCRENYSIADSELFVTKTLENWENGTQYSLAIFDAQSDEFLGGTGINQITRLHNRANLGYWVRTSRQNRGVASQAARLSAKSALEDLEINRIEIVVAVGNTASRKAAEKSGATCEGILRKRLIIGEKVHDAAMFSFIREDFELNL